MSSSIALRLFNFSSRSIPHENYLLTFMYPQPFSNNATNCENPKPKVHLQIVYLSMCPVKGNSRGLIKDTVRTSNTIFIAINLFHNIHCLSK